MKKILVVNSGSSSIKVKIFDKTFNQISDFLFERIGVDGNIVFEINNEKEERKELLLTHDDAIKQLIKILKEKKLIENFNKEISVIGHRVVFGGEKFFKPVLVTKEVKKQIKEYFEFAPLHNPQNLQGILSIEKICDVPNVVVFDTTFHTTIPKVNFIYPLPYKLYEKNKIKKYGAHGISYDYTIKKFNYETKRKKSNIIIFHLGNGSSICAIKNNKSFNTSMGLTPLAGLMMGTRCGDIDPAIVVFLQKNLGYSLEETYNLLNNKSGFFGISNGYCDIRDIISNMYKGNEKAKLAFDLFINRLVSYFVMYLNELENKIDGIVFTGGIGYNSELVIQDFVKKVKITKLSLKRNLNSTKKYWDKISAKNSSISIYRSLTNEELCIAKEASKLIKD